MQEKESKDSLTSSYDDVNQRNIACHELEMNW